MPYRDDLIYEAEERGADGEYCEYGKDGKLSEYSIVCFGSDAGIITRAGNAKCGDACRKPLKEMTVAVRDAYAEWLRQKRLYYVNLDTKRFWKRGY